MDIELNDNQYLLNYKKDFASQFGEDGMKKSKSLITDDTANSTWSWIREYKSFLDNKTEE